MTARLPRRRLSARVRRRRAMLVLGVLSILAAAVAFAVQSTSGSSGVFPGSSAAGLGRWPGIPGSFSHTGSSGSSLPSGSSGTSGTPSAAVLADHPEIGLLLRWRNGVPLGHCVATVVSSPGGDVVLTAAHCLGRRDTYSFAPGFDAAGAPLGMWTVVSVHTDPSWQQRVDPLDDYAFLTVRPGPGGADLPVQQVTGALRLGVMPGDGTVVKVIGYPSDRHGGRITCTATVRATGAYPTVTCPYFAGGTSGSPMISAHRIVGLIGGLQFGGCVADVSYTPPFTQAMRTVLTAAENGAPSSPDPANKPEVCSSSSTPPTATPSGAAAPTGPPAAAGSPVPTGTPIRKPTAIPTS